jgi:HEAT repeat protein
MPARRFPVAVLPLPLFLLVGLYPLSAAQEKQAAEEQEEADVKLLRENGLASDGPALLAYLARGSLTDADRTELEATIRRLGDDSFPVREKASVALVQRGRLAVPFLQKAVDDPDAEIARRAARCLEEIEQGPGPELPAAVIRLLARRAPAGAVADLLRYLPFAEDTSVEDEAFATLSRLGLRDGKPDPALSAALGSKQALARAAAGHVLGRSTDAAVRNAAARLLSDGELVVRFRTAQGLVGGRDRRGVPILIDLLADAPPDLAGRVEDLLVRLAGEQVPDTGPGAGSPAERRDWRKAWAGWWKEHGERVDLARAEAAPPFLNLTLVPEMHGNKVWECGKDGKPRWVLDGLQQPRDAFILPNGHVLVAEVTASRITERDRKNKIVWQHPVQDPAYIEGLPNGHVFIGTHHRAVEVTRGGKEVWSYESEMAFFIHSMNRKPNGHLVCLSMNGQLREVDRAGKTVVSFALPHQGNWCGVQGLTNGHYLAVELNQGHVLELDAKGKTLWDCRVAGACYAIRRPNGNTMVCSFAGQRVVDVNRAGKIVWEKAVPTQPWRAHSR